MPDLPRVGAKDRSTRKGGHMQGRALRPQPGELWAMRKALAETASTVMGQKRWVPKAMGSKSDGFQERWASNVMGPKVMGSKSDGFQKRWASKAMGSTGDGSTPLLLACGNHAGPTTLLGADEVPI